MSKQQTGPRERSTGHEYAQIPTDCPVCGGSTEWGGAPEVFGDAVYIDAWCVEDGCNWRGTANLRIIDYEGESVGAAGAVAQGLVEPKYHEYPTLDEMGDNVDVWDEDGTLVSRKEMEAEK